MAHLTRDDGTTYNVVNAEERGDRCFIGKKGFFWYDYTDKWAIDEATVSGPFGSFEAAFLAAEERELITLHEHPQNCGCPICSLQTKEHRFTITQTQLNRIREICQIGTQAHGDEFYEQIMATLDATEKL